MSDTAWLESIEKSKQLFNTFRDGRDETNFILNQIGWYYNNEFSKGAVLDPETLFNQLDSYVAGNRCHFFGTPTYKEYKASLLEINYQYRKKCYLEYSSLPETDIFKIQAEEVGKYKSLLTTFQNYPRLGFIKKDAVTLNFVESFIEAKAPTIRYGDIQFDTAYDVLTAINNSTNNYRPFSEKLYNELMEYLTQKVEFLSKMSPDEFREYKIGQIKLNFEEINRINREENREKVTQPIITPQSIEEAKMLEDSIPTAKIPEKQNAPTILLSKMTDNEIKFPREFQEAIVRFLIKTAPKFLTRRDIQSQDTETRKTKFEDGTSITPAVVLSGIITTKTDENGFDCAEYCVASKDVGAERYHFRINSNDMYASLTYDYDNPNNLTYFNASKHKNVEKEPRYGINGVDFRGMIFPTGKIQAFGETYIVPSSYDENGKTRRVSKERQDTFSCENYEELNSIIDNHLKPMQEEQRKRN